MTEITKLAILLAKANIPFEITSCNDAPQICYPQKAPRVCDAVCHKFSYGGEEGLLEILGLVSEPEIDSVEGWLTAEEVFERIKTHYETTKAD